MRTRDSTHIPARRQSIRLIVEAREAAADHRDAPERALLLEAISDEADARQMTWAQVHATCRLDDGALDSALMTTDALRAALRHLRALSR